jgi:hypothetical protein
VTLRDIEARPAPAEVRRRVVNDGNGTVWEVREIANPDYDRRGGNSLIFESSSVVRRVRSYPHNWYELPNPDLLAVSAKI